TLAAEFQDQVARHSEQLAVTDGERNLSFAELDRASNKLAHAVLDRFGPGAEPVALLFDQTVSAIVAILGVIKAGRIWMGLDPTAPPARVREILDLAGTDLLLCDLPHQGVAEA